MLEKKNFERFYLGPIRVCEEPQREREEQASVGAMEEISALVDIKQLQDDRTVMMRSLVGFFF